MRGVAERFMAWWPEHIDTSGAPRKRYIADMLTARRTSALAALLLIGCGGDDTAPPGPISTTTTGPGPDPVEFSVAPASCAFNCQQFADCPEAGAPYECPSLGDWDAVPHADACPAWDGRYPEVTIGRCEVSEASGEASLFPGSHPDELFTTILPTGRRLRPAGGAHRFFDAEVTGGQTTNLALIPGTSLLLTVDSGDGDHAVRLIDGDQIGGSGTVRGIVPFPSPATLNWGLAVAGPDRAYVASDDGVVHAFAIDAAAGTIARDDARSIPLPGGASSPWYASGVAVSPDGRILVASPVHERELLVFDADPASGTYGQLLGQADLGGAETFMVAFDPNDPTGQRAYVSMWRDREVVEVDLADPAAPVVARRFATEKNPQGLAFLDARWMVVANALGDSLTVVDRAQSTATSLPIDVEEELHGEEPSTLAWDPVASRLYVTLAGAAAVAAYGVDLATAPPTIAPAGRLPTLWWPSGVAVQGDGSLIVTSLRGVGTGPADAPYGLDDYNDRVARWHGGVQSIPAPSAADLAAGEATVRANSDAGALPGRPAVSCPDGARDFPVPATNTEGPSPVIDRVFIVIRENKTFDALLGDLPGAEGKPELLLKPAAEDRERIWGNLRALASRFSTSDNFYVAGELSTLGHMWTTYGRTNDFAERTWSLTGYWRPAHRSDLETGGVAEVGKPEEGSFFDWLGRNGVPYDVLGEGFGLPQVEAPGHPAVDFSYPGGLLTSIMHPDIEKACHVAGRARVRCDLGKVVYLTLPNDHGGPLDPQTPTPELMCAVNDEATGMLVEAISKSPLWRSSLILITEDDPGEGGDHVDAHRTILVAASPWVKIGHVSHAVSDISSIHKLLAHIFGLPYPNVAVAKAALPLDLFTSTPDYRPFDRIPRAWPLECGTAASMEQQKASEAWDVSEVDRSPELDDQVARWMRERPPLR